MNKDCDILIIGGGLAGLATGCYAQMNGWRTRIVEHHQELGGLCTAWQRDEYRIDGCIHWLMGAGRTYTWQDNGSSPVAAYLRRWLQDVRLFNSCAGIAGVSSAPAVIHRAFCGLIDLPTTAADHPRSCAPQAPLSSWRRSEMAPSATRRNARHRVRDFRPPSPQQGQRDPPDRPR